MSSVPKLLLVEGFASTSHAQKKRPELVDILRFLASRDSTLVRTSNWKFLCLDAYTFGGGGAGKNLYEQLSIKTDRRNDDFSEVINGQRLLELSANLFQTEECLLIKLSSNSEPVQLLYDYSTLTDRKPRFIASNADLQISCYEGPWEIITSDTSLLDAMCWAYEVSYDSQE